MSIKGNKGEWSEIYALFRLLGEGKVHAGDANLNKLEVFYPILCIIREESKRNEYIPNVEHNLVVLNENGEEFARIPMEKFIEESDYLIDKIRKGGNRAFSVPETECFMNTIRCSKIKAPSKDKADIHIIIHDLHTNMTPLLGFSIKSQLGSASTLLNAGIPTNITYQITGGIMNDEEIQYINGIDEHHFRIEEILKRGYKLTFHDIEHQTFKNNLLFLDCCMPRFIAACLLESNLPGASSSVKESVEKISKDNPFNYQGENVQTFYEFKMKKLLIDSALGMTAAKEWNGRYDANGGYLVVKKDGDIVCYHFYNRNDVEDYLYNNTRFDRASRERYFYGSLYRQADGNVYFKLNLQIRFKK